MQQHFAQTRIAPTPSGYLHIGNVLSFAITAVVAQQTGAKTLLRIDDLDQERVTPEYVQDIFDTLNFLELPWQEGPRNYEEYLNEYSQLRRMPIYAAALQQLWQTGQVYACTCSRSEILAHSSDGSYPGTCRYKQLPPDTIAACWRLRTDTAPITFNTLQGRVTLPFPRDMTDFVVRRKDRNPAYQLASVTDDSHYGTDLIVRGADLLPSTLAQLHLASVLGITSFLQTTFHHHPLVSGADGLKLSKSAGATSIKHLREKLHTPTAVYAHISDMLRISPAATNWEELGMNDHLTASPEG